jgi:hypothetical protein
MQGYFQDYNSQYRADIEEGLANHTIPPLNEKQKKDLVLYSWELFKSYKVYDWNVFDAYGESGFQKEMDEYFTRYDINGDIQDSGVLRPKAKAPSAGTWVDSKFMNKLLYRNQK